MIPVEQWAGLEVGQAITTGNRSSVWQGALEGEPVAIRCSKRTKASLDWELDLLVSLTGLGFVVPEPLSTQSGKLRFGSWTVQRWIEGRPPTSESDWLLVTAELRRLHRSLDGHRQRPGACSITELRQVRRSIDADLDKTPSNIVERCLPHFNAYLEGHIRVIHGDPGPDNIRITPDGRVGLLDWDEARVDVPDLDLANLGIPVLSGQRHRGAEAAAHAWETLNGWIVEPRYAASRLERLPGAPSFHLEHRRT